MRNIFVIHVLCLARFLVCSLQRCGLLLGKGWYLGSLVCDFCILVFYCVFLTLSCGVLVTDLCPYLLIVLTCDS